MSWEKFTLIIEEAAVRVEKSSLRGVTTNRKKRASKTESKEGDRAKIKKPEQQICDRAAS